jgi:hypothetical protein
MTLIWWIFTVQTWPLYDGFSTFKILGDSHFWLALWWRRSTSSHMVLSQPEMAQKLGSGRTNGLVTPHFENNIWPYTTMCATLAKVLETSPPNVSFRRHLIGPRLSYWYALLQRLALIHLKQGLMNFDGIYMKVETSQCIQCTRL